MIDKLFFVILVLNATGLFRFLAPQLGVSIGQVSIALLVLNVLYLIAKTRYSAALLLGGGIVGWLSILLLWPLFTLLYSPSFEIREIGLLLYCFSLFFGAVVYTVANGLPSMYRVLSVSLFVTIVGLALSMLVPGYFKTVAALADARSEYMGRPFGFSMQPNSLAIGFGFLFIGWFSLWRRKNTFLEVIAILVFLLVVLFVGSRTGMLLAAVAVMFIVGHSWRKRLGSGRYLLKICLLIACLAGGIIGMNHYVSNMSDSMARRQGDLIDRMKALLSFKLSYRGGLKDDQSLQERFATQAVYLSLVKEKPLQGHGFGSNTYYLENGPLFLSAHSQALTWAMEYGVLYPFAFAILILQLYRRRSRRDVEGVLQTNSVIQFVSIVLLIFIVGSLADHRTFYVVLGMFFAMVYCPRYVFRYDENTGKISSCMTRREIAKRFGRKRGFRKPLEPSPSAECGMAEEDKASG